MLYIQHLRGNKRAFFQTLLTKNDDITRFETILDFITSRFTILSNMLLYSAMYLFIRQSESGKAPIETIMPEVVRMPLYILINDPLGTVWGVKNVKRNVKMADFKPHECLAV